METIIGSGAEAVLIHKDGILIKRRIKKGYRINALDEKLRKARTRVEAKLIAKASEKINAPEILRADDKRTEIDMEFIAGKVLSDNLDELNPEKAIKICRIIGNEIAEIHDLGLIHGDLTTSNMILKEDKIFFIDFGLGFHSSRIEDKAVDLHLLKQALGSRHFGHWKKYFDSVIEGYKKSENSEKVLEQLKKVESRGRYKGKH